VSESTSVSDISTRAAAYNIPGVTADGNDILAVYSAANEAVNRARIGGGPSLLEFKTFRWHPHFADDSDFRSAQEKESWKAKDPVPRFEAYLEKAGVVEAARTRIAEEARHDVQVAVDFAKQSEWPDPKEAYEGVFV
jgi:pyruvate dehydrogenase E1 component alpha subunit